MRHTHGALRTASCTDDIIKVEINQHVQIILTALILDPKNDEQQRNSSKANILCAHLLDKCLLEILLIFCDDFRSDGNEVRFGLLQGGENVVRFATADSLVQGK